MDERGPAVLAVDIGTTHCKAGLFVLEGKSLRIAGIDGQAMHPLKSSSSYSFFDPAELWQTVQAAIRAVSRLVAPRQIVSVGIASMAETGLLVDRVGGEPRSPMLPWYDSVAACYEDLSRPLVDHRSQVERFTRSGIRPSFKASLAKILWLRSQDESLVQGSTWLSAADFVAYRLTGSMGTDYSLAGRTYAFRIDRKTWDGEWLGQFGLSSRLFPRPLPSGVPVGECQPSPAEALGLLAGTPVAICGHDHVCAAFAAGACAPGRVFDSMGTAETLIGVMAGRELGEQEYASRLAYGCHVLEGRYYWLGGLSASGGSVEWLRSLLGDSPLSYPEIESLAMKASPEPTGILYFPYLAGSGTPHPDPQVKGAFIGLKTRHTRADIVKAILEGTAFEMEYIRRQAVEANGRIWDPILAAGGGTRNRIWMQIKADVSGCRFEVPAMPEATLLGAALLAGIGAGVFADETTALAARPRQEVEIYSPQPDRHQAYRALFERGYLVLQEPLRAFG
jgi:xylulokinase